jgi:hypothetical protein
MKRLLLVVPFLLMLTGCKLKFHYGDCVKIDDDFFGTTYGVVLQYNGGNMYTVDRTIGNITSQYLISDNFMTKVDDKFCANSK